MIFIDLKNAYNSAPRGSPRTVLVKCSVPPTMLSIVQSFHEGMEAGVRVKDVVTDRFEIRNGLW